MCYIISNMEWRINFKLLMLILLALQCVCSSDNTVYYVRPISPQGVDCPRDKVCHSLSYYGTDELEPPENNTVTMILIEGNHSAVGNVYNFGSPDNSDTLHVIGDSQSNYKTVIDELRGAITVRNMTLERFTT